MASNPRVDRVRTVCSERGIDAFFVSAPKSVRYLTGFRPMMPGEVQAFADPEALALISSDAVHVLCDGRYIEEASAIEGVETHRIANPTTPQVVANALTEILGEGTKTVAFEADALLHADALGLMNAAPAFDWCSTVEMISSLRAIKTKDEIERIRTAQALTGQCFAHMASWLKPGVTERAGALEIERWLKENSEGSAFDPIVSFGETCCHPHYVPQADRKLEKGHMILLDFGAIHEGYCGDLTRMLVLGPAGDRLREVYDLVLAAQERCIEAVRPGAVCHDLDARCRDHFAENDVADAYLHSTGHGIGLAVHEAPRVKPTIEETIDADMVFTVEPGLYFAGWGGVRIEDIVRVTADGVQNLTDVPKTLVELS